MSSRVSIVVFAWLLAVLGLPAFAADDLGYIDGKYAVTASDCKKMETGAPFSKQWVDAIDSEVLTREGITSPRETHCKFKSSSGGSGKWTVKSSCEEMGADADYDVAIEAGKAGALIVTSEDVFGPPLTFAKCGN